MKSACIEWCGDLATRDEAALVMTIYAAVHEDDWGEAERRIEVPHPDPLPRDSLNDAALVDLFGVSYFLDTLERDGDTIHVELAD